MKIMLVFIHTRKKQKHDTQKLQRRIQRDQSNANIGKTSYCYGTDA